MPRSLAIALLLLFVGCAGRLSNAEVQTVNALVFVTNTAVDELALAYQLEGERVIDQAATADDAERALELVRARWAPIWTAYDALERAYEGWRTSDGELLVTALYGPYCAFRDAAAERFDLPDFPAMSCELRMNER